MCALNVVIMILAGVLGLLFFMRFLAQWMSAADRHGVGLRRHLERLSEVRREADAELALMGERLAQTVRIYEAARDVCATLEEKELWERFCFHLKKMAPHTECALTDEQEGVSAASSEETAFVLGDKEGLLGRIRIRGMSVQHYPNALILVRQFSRGLRRARLYRAVQELAVTDSLTGTATRRYAAERIDEEVARGRAYNLDLTFMMIDIDDFKAVNDIYGHLVGDLILCEVARRIRQEVREVDMIGRYGGEEFMVLAPQTGRDGATILAERMRRSVAGQPVRAYDETIQASISVGVAIFPQDADSAQALIEAADRALYAAKAAGKNCVRFAGAA